MLTGPYAINLGTIAKLSEIHAHCLPLLGKTLIVYQGKNDRHQRLH